MATARAKRTTGLRRLKLDRFRRAIVRAAGGVVIRLGQDGAEVLLVHRPRYDDWSFPKGKAEPDEPDDVCALREVEEETGLRCELERQLGTRRYRTSRGRRKVVRYFLMRPLAGEFRPHREVDEVRWLPLEAARFRLTHPDDAALLDDLPPR